MSNLNIRIQQLLRKVIQDEFIIEELTKEILHEIEKVETRITLLMNQTEYYND
jgi:hypothetical protein